MDLDLDGTVFVVGGGSAGLGLATATALHGEGARVVLAARDADRLAAAAAALGPGTATLAGDLADDGYADALVATALARFGRLDGVLANVGGPPRGGVGDTTDADWEAGFRSAFLGPVRLARTVIAHLRSPAGDGGSVAFVLSTSAKTPLGGLAVSNGLRPGLAMHVKDLADAYGDPPRPVRVVGLLPGSFATARAGAGARAAATADPALPLRRIGEPAEFGRVAAFLLSPAASYVTGTTLMIDGGRTRAL